MLKPRRSEPARKSTSKSSTDRQLEIGRVVGAFGLRGEVKVSATDPAEVRPRLRLIAAIPGLAERELVVAGVQHQKAFAVVRFHDIRTATQAEALAGAILSIAAGDAVKLRSGAYRDADLIGLRVVDAALGYLGDVVDVAHYPNADMLVVGGQRRVIPMLKVYGVRVDARAKTVRTHLPEGFEDL